MLKSGDWVVAGGKVGLITHETAHEELSVAFLTGQSINFPADQITLYLNSKPGKLQFNFYDWMRFSDIYSNKILSVNFYAALSDVIRINVLTDIIRGGSFKAVFYDAGDLGSFAYPAVDVSLASDLAIFLKLANTFRDPAWQQRGSDIQRLRVTLEYLKCDDNTMSVVVYITENGVRWEKSMLDDQHIFMQPINYNSTDDYACVELAIEHAENLLVDILKVIKND